MKRKNWYWFRSALMVIGLLILAVGCDDNDEPEPVNPETVTDVDGNVYPVVQIGNQFWMAENLKTTRYNDGSPIDYPADNDRGWQNNTTGAYSWYNNSENFKDLYGASYNWYAVNNSAGLCPTGWKVPSDQDWIRMMNYLGTEHRLTNDLSDVNAIGNKLKSCRQVDSPLGGECATDQHPRWNFDATNHGTNEFGFNALPGGGRGIDGVYQSIGAFGFWWNSDEASAGEAMFRYINFDQSIVFHGDHPKSAGLAVRCIKN